MYFLKIMVKILKEDKSIWLEEHLPSKVKFKV